MEIYNGENLEIKKLFELLQKQILEATGISKEFFKPENISYEIAKDNQDSFIRRYNWKEFILGKDI